MAARQWLTAWLVALLLAAGTARAGETVLADPPPSMDEPRRIMLTLTSDDATTVNNVLYNVVNVQKFYGMDNVEVAVIAYGAGVRALLKDSSPVAERISSLQMYGVEFIACGNTMTTMKKLPEDLLDGVDWVTAGIPEVVERRIGGWHYIHP